MVIEDGGAEVVAQPLDMPPHIGAALRIKAGGRLVQEHQRRAVHQTQRDVQPATLTAGERLDVAASQVAELQLVEQQRRALGGGSGGEAVEARLELQFLPILASLLALPPWAT